MDTVCKYLGLSRSGYYAWCKRREETAIKESIVVELVRDVRKILPRIGGKKLYFMLQKDLQQAGKTGRDKFFEILKRNGLLVERKRSYTRTTNSYHRFYTYKNLLKENAITKPDECYVADITYIRTEGGFVYLFLLTDYYSRKITGWSLSKSLSIEGGLESLRMALKQCKNTSKLIHHSDRGIQYCSKDYIALLQKNKVRSSMTEENHCYENSKAERVNGILKDEFLLDSTFKNFAEAHKATSEAIKLYNEIRPHWALDLRTPDAVHRLAS
jgi:transposase InsO family protein